MTLVTISLLVRFMRWQHFARGSSNLLSDNLLGRFFRRPTAYVSVVRILRKNGFGNHLKALSLKYKDLHVCSTV